MGGGGQPTTLSIIVTEEAGESDYFEAGPREALRALIGRKKEVPLEKVKEDLTEVQQQVGELLDQIHKGERNGFSLSEVSVSLSVSAEGSIGVVTVGAEAAITLTFNKA